MKNQKTCFVVCPIGEEGSTIRKQSDQVLKYIIEPVCKEKGFEAIRVDKINNTDKIDSSIIEYLQTAELVIADLSEHNPNAFFELGYRKALEKPVIQIIEEENSIPFDIANVRTINYKLSDPDKIESAKTRISEVIDVIFNSNYIENCNLSSDNPNKSMTSSLSNINSQILMSLLDISDEIKELKEMIKDKDNKNLEQIISVFTEKITNVSTPQDRFVEYALKEFMKNPDKTLEALKKIPEVKSLK